MDEQIGSIGGHRTSLGKPARRPVRGRRPIPETTFAIQIGPRKRISRVVQIIGSAILVLSAPLAFVPSAADPPPPPKSFAITVVDDQTGRGVPLVELQTINNVRYYTDSN